MPTKTEIEKIKCFGCGASVDNIEGEPHKYIGRHKGVGIYTDKFWQKNMANTITLN